MRRMSTVLVTLLLAATAGCGGGTDDATVAGSGGASPSVAPSGGSEAGEGSGAANDGAASSGESQDLSPEEQAASERGAPGLPDARGRQGDVLSRVPGNATGRCDAVGSDRDVRSGGFMAGPFNDLRASWGKARQGFAKNEVRLYLVPLHAGKMPGVTVTATSGSQTVRVEQKSVADAEQWRYYDVRLTLPSKGTWTVKASAGVDSGCWRVGL